MERSYARSECCCNWKRQKVCKKKNDKLHRHRATRSHPSEEPRTWQRPEVALESCVVNGWSHCMSSEEGKALTALCTRYSHHKEQQENKCYILSYSCEDALIHLEKPQQQEVQEGHRNRLRSSLLNPRTRRGMLNPGRRGLILTQGRRDLQEPDSLGASMYQTSLANQPSSCWGSAPSAWKGPAESVMSKLPDHHSCILSITITYSFVWVTVRQRNKSI